MTIIYNNRTDTINLRKFKVLIPGDYEPVLHDYHRIDGMQPIHHQDGEQSVSYLAIKDIIDMHFKQIEFTICDPTDVQLIIDTLDGYLNETSNLVSRDHSLKVFTDRCRATLLSLQHIENRKHRFIEKTTGNSSGRKNIIDILRRMY